MCIYIPLPARGCSYGSRDRDVPLSDTLVIQRVCSEREYVCMRPSLLACLVLNTLLSAMISHSSLPTLGIWGRRDICLPVRTQFKAFTYVYCLQCELLLIIRIHIFKCLLFSLTTSLRFIDFAQGLHTSVCTAACFYFFCFHPQNSYDSNQDYILDLIQDNCR